MQTTGLKPMMRTTYLATVILAVVSSFFCLSCGNKDKQLGAAVTNRDSTACVTTRGVDMLISEDGVVRYHVIAEEWKFFDKLVPQLIALEKGATWLRVHDVAETVQMVRDYSTMYTSSPGAAK